MTQLMFGGPFSHVVDPTLHVRVQPRGFGEAELRVVDDRLYNRTVGEAESPQAIEDWIKRTILKHAGAAFEALVERSGVLRALQGAGTLGDSIAAAAAAELSAAGIAVQIHSLTISLADNDLNAVKAASAARARRE